MVVDKCDSDISVKCQFNDNVIFELTASFSNPKAPTIKLTPRPLKYHFLYTDCAIYRLCVATLEHTD